MNKCVYVVDDDTTINKLIEWYLTTIGHRTITSCCFDAAEDFFRSSEMSEVDLVMVDLDLAGKNGLDLIRLLKELKTTSHIPVIAISATSSEKFIFDAFAAGAFDFIIKPFRHYEFIARVENALRKRVCIPNEDFNRLQELHLRALELY